LRVRPSVTGKVLHSHLNKGHRVSLNESTRRRAAFIHDSSLVSGSLVIHAAGDSWYLPENIRTSNSRNVRM